MSDITVEDVEIKPFEELSLRELHDILWLRNVVFVVGQKITAEPEVDGLDPECEHVMLWSGDRLIGTTRIFHKRDPIIVGRVAIHTDLQKQGLGSVMMEAVQAHLGDRRAELHAQAHLEDWYARLGWVRFGEEYIEAEIPHVSMRWG